jgi:hypothetical protein
MRKLKFVEMTLDPDFPGFTNQDICEQVRKMHNHLEKGFNPFTGQSYGHWDTYRHTPEDVEEVKKEMSKYCIE